MDNEEIQQLITELRRMLVENGFSWIANEAEADLAPIVAPRTRALALIDAVEGATTQLAEIEISALDVLNVEDIHFEADEERFPDGRELLGDAMEGAASSIADQIRGARRRARLELLAEKGATFKMLRGRLNGDE